jgi:S-formylglutathione hydrolase FrmB
VINVLAMAACYSPNLESSLGFDLPMDLQTGERKQAVWKRWLAFDPLNAVGEHAAALQRLKLLHLECGLRDEFHLQWGTRRLSNRLRALGVPHDHEEHEGGHRGLDPRLLALLPKLIAALD